MDNRAFDYSRWPDWINPADVTPYERNAKEHPDEQIKVIANSIKRFGWQQDCVITRDNVLVIGHGRRLAAMQIGCKMPVHRVDKDADELTDEEIKALRLADNKTNESAWNFETLDAELQALDMAGMDMTEFGFDDIPRGGIDSESTIEDDYDVDAPVEPKAKRGDIYRLGRHRLMCGDSTSAEDVARLMDGEKADMLLTDPPYNVNLGSQPTPTESNIRAILNDNMDEREFIRFLTKALQNADYNMRPGAAYYIWYTGLHHIEFESAVRAVEDFKLHEQLIWVKSHFVLGRNSDYQWMHECCLYGWKDGAAHYFTDSRAESTVIEDGAVKLSTMKKGEIIALCEKLMGLNKAQTVLRADKPNTAEMHPTVKPQALLVPLVCNSSERGWKVLDPFGGSGSTIIACQQNARQCYTMELDPHYVDVIIARWETFTGEKAELINATR